MRAVAGLGSPIALSSGGPRSCQSLPEASDVCRGRAVAMRPHRGPTVRIHPPPAKSHANFRFLSGGARIVEKLSPIVTGYVVAATGSFNTAFVVAGALALVGRC